MSERELTPEQLQDVKEQCELLDHIAALEAKVLAWRECAEKLAEALRYVTFERTYTEPKIAKANTALAEFHALKGDVK